MAGTIVLRALESVWSGLVPLRLPMAIMGGIALSFWGRMRATPDLELLIQVDERGHESILQALEAAGARRTREPSVLAVGSLRFLQLQYEPVGSFVDIEVDLLLADSPYQQQALRRRVPVSLPSLGTSVFVLSCEDLILHKLVAGRIIDMADAIAMLRINRANLDLAYVGQWSVQLGLEEEWSTTWREAFPGEDSPLMS